MKLNQAALEHGSMMPDYEEIKQQIEQLYELGNQRILAELPVCGQPKGTQMNREQIALGMTVKRIASDYTGGRIGRVIDLDGIKPRARVSWEQTRNGEPMKLRTWVRLSDLEPVITDTTRAKLVQRHQCVRYVGNQSNTFLGVENKTSTKK